MASETTPPKPATPPTLDWKKAEEHLAAVKKKIMDYAGKPGMNPFLWWRDKGQQLETALADMKNRNEATHKSVLALTFEEPKAPELGVKLRKATPVKPV